MPRRGERPGDSTRRSCSHFLDHSLRPLPPRASTGHNTHMRARRQHQTPAAPACRAGARSGQDFRFAPTIPSTTVTLILDFLARACRPHAHKQHYHHHARRCGMARAHAHAQPMRTEARPWDAQYKLCRHRPHQGQQPLPAPTARRAHAPWQHPLPPAAPHQPLRAGRGPGAGARTGAADPPLRWQQRGRSAHAARSGGRLGVRLTPRPTRARAEVAVPSLRARRGVHCHGDEVERIDIVSRR